MLQQPPVQHGQISMAQVFPHLTAAAQTPAAPLVLGHVTLHLSCANGLAGGLHLRRRGCNREDAKWEPEWGTQIPPAWAPRPSPSASRLYL